MRPVLFLRASLVFLLAVPALAQLTPTTVSGVELVPWTLGAGGGSFTDGAVGDLDGDGQPDAVILRGGTLVFAHAVDVFTNLTAVDEDVTAFALFGGTDAEPEGFAAVKSAGLYSYVVDTSGGTVVVTRTLIHGGSWAGAVDVQRADWNGDGEADLVGLSSDRAQILVLERSGSGWGTTEHIPLPETIESFEPVQWESDLELEIVLVNDQGATRVYDGDGLGPPLYTRGSSLSRTRIAVLPDGLQDGTDRVALYQGNATGTIGYLTVFDRFGTETAVSFAGELPHAFSSRDLDGDGLPDLAVTFESTGDVMIAENLSLAGSPTFDPADPDRTYFLGIFEHLDLQPVVPANHAPACLGDFDGDGRMDILLPSDAASGTVLLHGPYGELVEVPNSRWIVQGVSEACVEDDLARLTFDFAYPSPSSEAVEFQIGVFRQADVASTVTAQAISTCFVPRSQSGSYTGVEIHLPDDAAWTPSNPNIYHLVLRPVNDVGHPVDAALIASFTLDPLGFQGLDPAPGWEDGPDPYDTLVDCGQAEPADPGGDPIGGFLSAMRLPELPQGEVPVFAQTCL